MLGPVDELLVIAATIKTKALRQSGQAAVHEVVSQTAPTSVFRPVFWPASTDPCLQAADYCCWAIQRKWEKGDSRSYDLIGGKVRSEFEVFGRSGTLYY